MIPDEIVEQIAAANDIVDVIGGYFPLKRAGSAFKALCPFHQEKSPSFTVNPQRQRFHCFGCGAGGSVFDFVARYESVDFPTAARRLAERAGIQVVEAERTPAEDRKVRLHKQLLALHQQTAEWFHKLLLEDARAKTARNYLKGRGIGSEIAQHWKIGYAPEGWDLFGDWAQEQGFRREELVQSGLVSLRDPENPESEFYDRFRDRVMFPICNDFGEVIAFSGRVLNAEAKGAKYVNSPETPLFKKGDVLFGLHKSKRALVDSGTAIVLEGQLDLITSFEAGVQNVVAPQGTAFTEKQARTLKRYVEEVVLCFDADEAGQKATERSLPALLGLNLGVRVIELPAGADPDSLIRAEGADSFTRHVREARDYFDFQIDTQARTEEFATPRGKVKFAHAMAAVVQLIHDRMLREAVAAKVATRLGLPLTEFWSMAASEAQKGRSEPISADQTAVTPVISTKYVGDHAVLALRSLTLLALRDPAVCQWIAAQPWSEQLDEMEAARLLAAILHTGVCADDAASLAAFTAGLGPEDQSLINAMLREKLPPAPVAVAQEYWRGLERHTLERRRDVQLGRLREPNLTPGEGH